MDFTTLPVSTQTYIVRSNIETVDLDKCYANIYPTESVLAVKYKARTKGECAKPVKNSIKNFLNCVTLSVMSNKKINVKIFNNGVFQLTGCKTNQHVSFSVDTIFQEFIKAECFSFQRGETNFVYYVVSAMRNVDFEIGFKIDREALGTFISTHTEYSVPPMTTGYMGVKIKIPIDSVSNVLIPKVTYDSTDFSTRSVEYVTYDDFFRNIYPNPKKINKKYYVSISVFQNGKVLMSGIDESVQISSYEWFIKIVNEMKNLVGIDKREIKTFRRNYPLAI